MIVDLFAGTLGGIMVVLVGHPFDTTKIRLQTAPAGFYSGTMDCVRKTWVHQGFSGFYAGMLSPLVGQMFFRSASFAAFHQGVSLQRSRYYLRKDDPLPAPQLMVTGAATGLIISFIESPIDFVKTRLQTQVFSAQAYPGARPKYSTVPECVTYFYRKYGMKSFYHGFSGTVIRNIPANSLYFPVNELVKMTISEMEGKSMRDITIVENMFAGATAGLCYWVTTYPLDVIKSRMQNTRIGEGKGWLQTAYVIWKEGGLRAYGRGLVPCVARCIPACAVMFTTVDMVRNMMAATP